MSDKTNLEYWAFFPAGFAGMGPEDFGIKVGERKEDGNYDATFLVPAEKEWQIARLLMHLLSNNFVRESRPMQVTKTEHITRITVEYPGYLGDPNAEHKY
ncbi:hypothetical protein [Streptomyces sp. NPDC005281]|uniref:hypothetical protein n=1 Tax=Streptomyces sp. NPDC005281 TaxID=3155712 RepID=UPI0033B910B4